MKYIFVLSVFTIPILNGVSASYRNPTDPREWRSFGRMTMQNKEQYNPDTEPFIRPYNSQPMRKISVLRKSPTYRERNDDFNPQYTLDQRRKGEENKGIYRDRRSWVEVDNNAGAPGAPFQDRIRRGRSYAGSDYNTKRVENQNRFKDYRRKRMDRDAPENNQYKREFNSYDNMAYQRKNWDQPQSGQRDSMETRRAEWRQHRRDGMARERRYIGQIKSKEEDATPINSHVRPQRIVSKRKYEHYPMPQKSQQKAAYNSPSTLKDTMLHDNSDIFKKRSLKYANLHKNADKAVEYKLLDKLAPQNLYDGLKESKTEEFKRASYDKESYAKIPDKTNADFIEEPKKETKRTSDNLKNRKLLDILSNTKKNKILGEQEVHRKKRDLDEYELSSKKSAGLKSNEVQLENLEKQTLKISEQLENLRKRLADVDDRISSNNRHIERTSEEDAGNQKKVRVKRSIETERGGSIKEEPQGQETLGTSRTMTKRLVEHNDIEKASEEDASNQKKIRVKRSLNTEEEDSLTEKSQLKKTMDSSRPVTKRLVESNDRTFEEDAGTQEKIRAKKRLDTKREPSLKEKSQQATVDSKPIIKRLIGKHWSAKNTLQKQPTIETHMEDKFEKSNEMKKRHAKNIFQKFLDENKNTHEKEIKDVKENKDVANKAEGQSQTEPKRVEETDILKEHKDVKDLDNSQNSGIGFVSVKQVQFEDPETDETYIKVGELTEVEVVGPIEASTDGLLNELESDGGYENVENLVSQDFDELDNYRVNLLLNIVDLDSSENSMERNDPEDNPVFYMKLETLKGGEDMDGFISKINADDLDEEAIDEYIEILKSIQLDDEDIDAFMKILKGTNLDEESIDTLFEKLKKRKLGYENLEEDFKILKLRQDHVRNRDNNIDKYFKEKEFEDEEIEGIYIEETPEFINIEVFEIKETGDDTEPNEKEKTEREKLSWTQSVGIESKSSEREDELEEERQRLMKKKMERQEGRKQEHKLLRQQELETRKLERQLENKRKRIKHYEGEFLKSGAATPPCTYEQRRGAKNLCNCKFPETCVRVYECTSPQCSFKHACMIPADARHICRPHSCKEKETCYIIQKASKEYSPGCLLVDKAVTKPGKCPSLRNPYGSSATHNESDSCVTDSDCNEDRKCCQLKELGQKVCTDPVADIEKPGLCPPQEFLNLLSAHQLCEKDMDCPQCLKCCEGAGINHCSRPISEDEADKWKALY